MNSIKFYNRMDTIFMNCEKRKTSDPHRLLLNLTDKINLKGNDKYVALSNYSKYYIQEDKNCHTKTINLKYQLQRRMINLNYLTDIILYQIFKTILSIPSKDMRQ